VLWRHVLVLWRHVLVLWRHVLVLWRHVLWQQGGVSRLPPYDAPMDVTPLRCNVATRAQVVPTPGCTAHQERLPVRLLCLLVQTRTRVGRVCHGSGPAFGLRVLLWHTHPGVQALPTGGQGLVLGASSAPHGESFCSGDMEPWLLWDLSTQPGAPTAVHSRPCWTFLCTFVELDDTGISNQ